MRDPIPRGPFDQGLLLAHFNKGRDLYEARRYEEAERQLEEAYLLRPRDTRVLNLLGLVYFKQDKFEKAEEVYRKLVAESPEAHILYYNLGLIYFKLSRLEDAEGAFLKALELSKESPKINFYLGSIYERLHRFTDAIFQYRHAGASLMVRRVQGKLAATEPSRAPAPPRIAAAAEAAEQKKKEEAQESMRRHVEEALAAERAVLPVSPALLAEATHPSAGTARFRVKEPPTAPPPTLELGTQTEPEESVPDTIPPGAVQAEGPPRARARPTEIFRFLQNNVIEIGFSGKVFVKPGTIYSYSGNLTFWVKEKRPGGQPALVIITGTGKLILTDRDREITLMHVENERIFVEPSHLLACEETLTPRYLPLEGSPLEFIALEGRGMVALSVASKPLTIAVTPGLPVSVASSSVVSWSGDLVPQTVADRQVYEVVLAPVRQALLIRFEGTGRILVEQTFR